MATTEFYNSEKQILVKFIAGPNSGVEYRLPKTTFTFYKVNATDFHVKAGEIGLFIKYSEVSTTNPAGHLTIEDLFNIFRDWCRDTSPLDASFYDDMHRQRVVEPTNVFEWNFRHDTEPRKFNTLTETGGTVTFMPNEQYVELEVDTTADARAVIQSKKYIPFQEGKSFQIQIAAQLRTTLAVTDNFVQLGYYDDANDKGVGADTSGSGVFLMMDAAGALSLVRRSFVGGVQTDTTVAQSSWNLDKLDGTGISYHTLDPTKVNVYIFEILMDSACSIRFGVLSGHGDIFYAHRFSFANVLATGGIFNATLPVRMEIYNGAAGTVGDTGKLFSGAVVSEGGHDEYYGDTGVAFTVDGLVDFTQAIVIKNTGDVKPVMSIRLKSTKCRTTIHPIYFMLINFKDNAQFKYRVVLNATLGGGTTWITTQLPADSAAEYDLLSTTVSGGTTLMSGYCSSKSERVSLEEMRNRLELYSSIDGLTTDTLTLVVEYINTDCAILGEISWIEYN